MRLLELRGAWFSYGDGWVLRGVSLHAAPGDVVAVTGPNASGKSTLLRLAAGLLEPARGMLLVQGRSLWSLPPRERLRLRRSLVYVEEDPVLVRGTVLDNIALGLRLRGVPAWEAAGRARWAAERLGLGPLLGEKPGRLSRGQRQLVAVARALALKPKVMLLDEPFAHLDREKRRLLAGLIEELAREGRAVIVASHNPLPLLRVASRWLLVENGSVQETQAPEPF